MRVVAGEGQQVTEHRPVSIEGDKMRFADGRQTVQFGCIEARDGRCIGGVQAQQRGMIRVFGATDRRHSAGLH